MAQAGIHALVGAAARKAVKNKKGVLLGLILGNLLPDADNLAVAVATLTGGSTEGLHRTFTHSIFTVLFVVVIFNGIGWITKKGYWRNLGLGLGLGILMHILLDMVVWFNGVQIFWPLPFYLNFWENVAVPGWWSKLMMPIEFLFMAAFLFLLNKWSRNVQTDQGYRPVLRWMIGILLVLFVVFTILVYVMTSGFLVPYGALYLVTLFTVVGVVIQMRKTIHHMELL